MRKRIVYFDYLRFIACLAVIGIHVAGKGTYLLGNNINSNPVIFSLAATIDSCLRFAVPIFFMLGGALAFSKSKMDIKEFYQQRAKRILIPLVFWGLFYSFVFNRDWPIVEHFKQVLLGNAFYHLWFLYAMIGLYLVTPVFYQFLKYSQKKDIEIILIVSFLLNSVLPIISSRYWVDLEGSFSFSYLTGSIFYFVLGYYLLNYDLKYFNRPAVAAIGYILSSIIISVCTVGASIKQQMHVTFYINTLWLLVIIQSTSLFVLLKSIAGHQERPLSKLSQWVSSLGQYFMGIYLVHVLILEIYQRIWIVDYKHVGIGVYVLHLICGSVVVYFGSLLFVMILKKIPIIKEVV